jgi:SMC interacting uncharacterized protein involved in chromosome segregation
MGALEECRAARRIVDEALQATVRERDALRADLERRRIEVEEYVQRVMELKAERDELQRVERVAREQRDELRTERDDATRLLAEASAKALLAIDHCQWLVGLDDPAAAPLRQRVTLDGIIKSARTALGLPDGL